ncbi:hypothetical protein [Sulfitobacter sp. R18_1]|uniref:hypothetical protein n=1 Tax=Sulfitobacter sp. R18_1 TaxID=2821104 RepID=UPI001ADBF4CF|nr:hypothetical protein [Sulfitobacter sp. R18_1]MBO9428272.1 hypothetical protein [Sulfitobacter sp. R18_1]
MSKQELIAPIGTGTPPKEPIVSLHQAQLRITELEGALDVAQKRPNKLLRFLKVSVLVGVGFTLGMVLAFDMNYRLRYSAPGYGFMCRMHDLVPVVTQTGGFGEYGKVHCVDMSEAVDERVLWEETKERILNKGKNADAEKKEETND